MVSDISAKRILFVFPSYVGHVNPSLPIARSLVRLGHEVHYMGRESMRAPIEDTGANFYSDVHHQPELYTGREPHEFAALKSMQKEHHIEDDSLVMAHAKLSNVMLELQLPGMLRFAKQLKPHVVVYCPMVNREAAVAAKLLGIPSVALITHAGPGSFETLTQQFLSELRMTGDDMAKVAAEFEPHCLATERMKETHGLELDATTIGSALRPLGKISTLANSTALVTTSEDLADRMTPDLAKSYHEDFSAFAYVGPLLDQEGAIRAGASAPQNGNGAIEEVVQKVRDARIAGRKVVLVSMGTVLTSDDPFLGWNGRLSGEDGRPRGLTGRELSQTAWAGAFDAFGSDGTDDGALIVVSVGKRPDALQGVQVPPNAMCLPGVPQVDILKAGVDVFLTHGGQNSFSEAMSQATPVVICPGFGDQKVNSRKAVDLGVGLKADRPDPDLGTEAEAMVSYRNDVRHAILEVIANPQVYRKNAQRCCKNLEQAGGVPRAVEVVLAQVEVTAPVARAGA